MRGLCEMEMRERREGGMRDGGKERDRGERRRGQKEGEE